MILDVKKLVADCGGSIAVARACGSHLSSVYRWIASGQIPVAALAALRREFDITVDDYFIDADAPVASTRNPWGKPIELTAEELRALVGLIERSQNVL